MMLAVCLVLPNIASSLKYLLSFQVSADIISSGLLKLSFFFRKNFPAVTSSCLIFLLFFAVVQEQRS